jgi:hypothetical protein
VVRTKIKSFASQAVGAGVPGFPCPPYKIIILDEAVSVSPTPRPTHPKHPPGHGHSRGEGLSAWDNGSAARDRGWERRHRRTRGVRERAGGWCVCRTP